MDLASLDGRGCSFRFSGAWPTLRLIRKLGDLSRVVRSAEGRLVRVGESKAGRFVPSNRIQAAPRDSVRRHS